MYCQSCLKAYTGDYIALSVRDTGVGISEEKISRIFDPFFTTKGVGKGTGLGLSVVSGIVHNAKGHICVESIVGQGTTFSLLFPAVAIEVQNEYEQIKTEISSDESPRAIRVAVIDDEEIICSLFHFSLTRLGYDVTVFNDPVEAWDTFSNMPDLFDVIITDYGMPIVTGLELAKSILGLRPEMPIFICTGYSEKIKFAEDLPKGNTFLFKKPTDVKALDKAIRQFFTTKG
jgi:CheY-like chemotaxis protein